MSDKHTLWEQKSRQVEKITDTLGKRIDNGIKDTVIGLQLLGINTRQSCEGHLNRGVCAPWIDISAPASPEIEQLEMQAKKAFQEVERLEEEDILNENITVMYSRAHELRRRLKGMYLQETMKIVPYLEAFYTNRQVSFDRRLILSIFANGRRCRLQSQGTDFQETRPDEVREQKLAEYQQEMKEFTLFLKEKFLNS